MQIKKQSANMLEDIFAACREGDGLQVRLWLEEPRHDLNQGDDHGFSPLHWACFAGRAQLAEMLLARGARINATNMGDDTALHLAASHGHLDCAQLLLRNRADVNAMNEHGNTALHYACFWGHWGLVELLVEHGAQANLANVAGETARDKCHRSLVAKLEELAREQRQDLSRRVSLKEAGRLQRQQEQRSRDAKLSRHPLIRLEELQLHTRGAASASGESWRGTWSSIEVQAKLINYGPECSARIVRDFNDEYQRLRIFSHPNVLPVIGACCEPPSLVLVSQYLALGSLHSLLHERPSKRFLVDQQQAARFALDIARGMAYLHSLEPLVPRLHLSSRHVLIDDQLSARISMADAKFSFQERHKVYQPAWWAPERLQRQECEVDARSADMWSFGVCLWELLARQVPFAGLSAIEVGMKVALEDLRLPLHSLAPSHLARLARIAMNEEPGKRPSFDQIVPILAKMAHASS